MNDPTWLAVTGAMSFNFLVLSAASMVLSEIWGSVLGTKVSASVAVVCGVVYLFSIIIYKILEQKS